MLTFFRRIRQTLLDSGQTRKYILYAVGEVLLVMIGILLALQVNNWNERRKERALGKENIFKLYTSLEEDLTNIENIIGQLESQLNSTERLLEIYESDLWEGLDSVMVLQDVINTSMSIIAERNENAFDQLMSNGNLKLIVDKTLVNKLTDFYKSYDSRLANLNLSPQEIRMTWRTTNSLFYSLSDLRLAQKNDYQVALSPNYYQHLQNSQKAYEILITIQPSCHFNIKWLNDLRSLGFTVKSYMEKEHFLILQSYN